MERQGTSSKVWMIATVVTVILHVGAAWSARALRLTRPEPIADAPADPIQMVFRSPEEPRVFTEQLPDPDDEAPETPDFLSNVDSRARDQSPNDPKETLPASDGRAPFPQVRMDVGEPAAPEPEAREAEAPEPAEEDPSPLSLASLVREQATPQKPEKIPRPGSPGMSDLLQEAMDNASGGATIRDDDIRLSTYAWNFAPWLMDFRRRVGEHWRAPPAYHMGLIHGTARMEIEIARDGSMLRTELLSEDVDHPSLTSAAYLALEGALPYRRLPGDFPDETLVLQIQFFYPNLKPSPAERRRADGPGGRR